MRARPAGTHARKEADSSFFVICAGALEDSGTAAQLGGVEKKAYLRVTSGKYAFVHGGNPRPLSTGKTPHEGSKNCGRYSPFSPLDELPSLLLLPPFGASFYDSPARAAATAVIPSILNLTSSHTRDEVIAVNLVTCASFRLVSSRRLGGGTGGEEAKASLAELRQCGRRG